jgi:Lar family restriction alleviation protein
MNQLGLKLCPFCGGDAVYATHVCNVDKLSRLNGNFVICKDCKAQSAPFDDFEPEILRNQWNKRYD